MTSKLNILYTGIILAGISLMILPIVNFSNKESECDQVIFLEGELSRDVNRVNYIHYGNMARIHYCDGSVEDVPTSRVIKIVNKEND